MEYRVLGRSGVKIAPLGLGTGNFADPTSEEEADRIINRAIDAGINLIDTGNSYSDGESERYIGRALSKGKRPSRGHSGDESILQSGHGA